MAPTAIRSKARWAAAGPQRTAGAGILCRHAHSLLKVPQTELRCRYWPLSVVGTCRVWLSVCSSQYCLHEFHSAFQHNAKRDKRLVMLTLLDNPLQLYTSDATEAAVLRQYVRNRPRRCIDLKDKYWLDKLLYALPVRPLAASDTDDAGDDVPLINTWTHRHRHVQWVLRAVSTSRSTLNWHTATNSRNCQHLNHKNTQVQIF